MRMWMIDPEDLCKKHLIGEHGEIHKHKHNFEKRRSIKGRIHPVVQIEPASMKSRHDALVQEMINRGYKHESPYEMPDLEYLPLEMRNARVDKMLNVWELYNKCPDCAARMDKNWEKKEKEGWVK